MPQTNISNRTEWGHISGENLISVMETAGVAGTWKNNIDVTSAKNSAWAQEAVKKEIKMKISEL